MLRAQLYTSAAGTTVAAIQFNGMNGASIAEWAHGTHSIPDPHDKTEVYPEYVEVPSFMGMMMHGYKGDYVVKVSGELIWYTLDEKHFLNLYAPVGVWLNFEGEA